MNTLPAKFASRLPAKKQGGLARAITTGLGTGSPPYVSIEGGQFTLVDSSGLAQSVDTKWLDCVIFDANYHVPIQRVFWGDPAIVSYGTNSGKPPVCFSDNGQGASAAADKPQSMSCQTCKWNKFDFPSKLDPTKKTKACNAIKKLAVLPLIRKATEDGIVVTNIQPFPFLLRVPVMSHENLQLYGLEFQPDDVVFDMHEVVTRISFAPRTGDASKNFVLQFQAAGFTDESTDAVIKQFLDDHRTDAMLGRGDIPWQGEIKHSSSDENKRSGERSEILPEPEPARLKPAAKKTVSGFGVGGSGGSGGSGGNSSTFAQQPVNNVPPFLRRPAQPSTTQSEESSHGITQAPEPPDSMREALTAVFGLKT